MKTFAKILCLSLVAVMLCATLASCAPASDPDKAISALKDAGYIAGKDTTAIPVALAVLGVKGIDTVISGTKSGEHVTVIYFTDSDSAKSAEEKVTKYVDDEEKDKKDDSDWVFKRSGKKIYWGTKNAVKDAR